MPEDKYKLIFHKYLSNSYDVDKFIEAFYEEWRLDRDDGTSISYDTKFQRLMDRIFTSCDCYTKNPLKTHEITEQELRNEVQLLSYIWWG